MKTNAFLFACALTSTISTTSAFGGMVRRQSASISATSSTSLGMSAVESRRAAFKSLAFGAFGATAIASPAFALDMDAFVNSELDKDTKAEKKEMTADEALCRKGQSGATKKVEACKRVKHAGGAITTKGQGKSLGGAYAM